MIPEPLLLTLGLLTLTTGVLLGLGTRFGLARYWWMVTKLVITVASCTLILLFASSLSVDKPWRVTPRGRRFLRVRSPAREKAFSNV